MTDIILVIITVIGTVSFAISGALVAVGCSLDLFGVIFTGCVTAVGGGVIRDIFLGHFPPAIFSNSIYIIVAALTSLAVFIVAYVNAQRFRELREKTERINTFFDALGLAVFSVAGVQVAIDAGYADNIIFVILMGMTTGVGGGICRDILVDKTPYILSKHVYALASILGSAVYLGLYVFSDDAVVSTIVASVLVVVIRLLAAHYRWELPKVHLGDKK